MSSPQVSVVLPTHNRDASLPRAVHSVLAQTYSDLELIVVDDGSTDRTEDVARSIHDPRLVYVRLECQQGAARARNAGIRRARGCFVAFQDSDDEWLPSKLEEQLALLAQHGPELGAIGGRYDVDGDSSIVHVTAPGLEAGKDYEADLLAGPCCITPLWLIRRPLLDELGLFDERMPSLEDWDLMLRLSERTGIRALPTTVLIKRGADYSLGMDVHRRAAAMQELLRRHRARFLAQPRRHASFCLELAYLCLLCGRRRVSLYYAARALRRWGASPRILASFGWACVRAGLLKRPVWPLPSLSGYR